MKELPKHIQAHVIAAEFRAEHERFQDQRIKAYAAKDKMEREWGLREGDKCGCPSCMRSSVSDYNASISGFSVELLDIHGHQEMDVVSENGQLKLMTKEEAYLKGYYE